MAGSRSLDDLGPLVSGWPVETVSAGVTDARSTVGLTGDPDRVARIASVGKLLVGMAAMVALEEGAIALDEPAGPEGSTVRHLLAHASGLAFDGDRVLSPPGRRRIYSNTGIEVFADHLATRTGMSFGEYLRAGVLQPLAMQQTELRGSPAHEVWSSVRDLMSFARELLTPTLAAQKTLDEATRPQFAELAGDVRALRWFGRVPVGRSRRRNRRRRDRRPGVRPLGARRVAAILRRGARTVRGPARVGSRPPRSGRMACRMPLFQ